MMSDLRTILERGVGGATPPPDGFERMLRRRDRKRRNQRIAAGVVGIAFFVAAIWIVTTGGAFDWSDSSVVPGISGTTGPLETGPGPNGPYTQPSYTLGRVTPRDIALGESFIDAWADGDGESAAAMFASDGTFDGFQPAVLPALHDWFRAEGWTFRAEGCGLHGWGPARGVVGCGYTYENDLTRALGILPVETTISFLTSGDGIETAWYGAGGDLVFDMFAGYRGREDVLGPVWDKFLDWISNTHREDLVRMYDPDHSYPILDAASIELWRRYTGEFLASPDAEALARPIRDAGWDGVGIPPEGELIADYDEFRVGFVFVYADGRVISQRAIASSGSGKTNEQLLTPEGVALVRSGAVSAEDFLLSSSPVPASAWEEAEGRPYAPARYAVCFYREGADANPGTVNGGYEYPSSVLRFLPSRAREILTGKEHTYGSGEDTVECSEVPTNEARDLWPILDGIRVEDAEGDTISWEDHVLLPHGEWEPKVDG
jgi:hypothetical protein